MTTDCTIFRGLLILTLLATFACSGQKKQAPEPQTYESESVASQSDETQPASTPQSREIDLGIAGEYGEVEIEESDKEEPKLQPPPDDGLDYSCETAEECKTRGLPRQKRPGEWHCVSNTCVMKYEESPIEEIEPL